LAAVLGIVRGHKGAVRVYSEPGQGTTFKVLFPVKTEEGAGVETRAKESVDLAGWTGKATILLVDDEETARTVAREVLQDRGFTVLLAANGKEAVETFAVYGDEIAAVILDLTMPVMDGKAAFEKIQEIRPGARVILSSGYTEQDVTTRFTGKAPDAFIQKPYTVRELLAKLRDVIGE
jgi:CheY-like chemotaxis protein